MELKANQLTPITFAAPGSEEAAELGAPAERTERKSGVVAERIPERAPASPSVSGPATTVSPLGENTGPDEATADNVRNWMECVQARKRPNADIEAGYNQSVALCMTIAAMQTGQRVSFDDTKQEVVIGAPSGHVHFQQRGSRVDLPGGREP
jgi:hypothetical protein